MRPYSDESAFDWIRQGRDEYSEFRYDDPRWKGNFVSNLLPKTFEVYAKVFHGISAHYENIDDPLTPNEVAILGIPACEKLRSFVETMRSNSQGTKIKWKEMAKVLDTPFMPELVLEWFRRRLGPEQICWPRFINGPSDGALSFEEYTELVRVLIPFTSKQESFFRFSETPYLASATKHLLFQGSLGELPDFLTESKYRFTPEFWWPPDQSWCVCSDFDLSFTIVAGSKKLISSLLNNTTLECIEVTPQTRIDSYAPIP